MAQKTISVPFDRQFTVFFLARFLGDGSVPQNPMFTAKSAIEMVDIPAGWEEHHSEEHGRNYYVHTETGRSVWTMDEMQQG